MPIQQNALDLENRNVGIKGEPTLAEAYKILKEGWLDGDRDRELGLHLMFLAWYGLVEPGHLTGFVDGDELRRELNQLLTEVHTYFEPKINQDAEMLYVVGLAAHMFWFMFDDASAWEKRAIEYRQRYHALAPNGIDPAMFQNRGAYGAYYAGQVTVKGGY
jgi:hypothetical protein